uniref:Uncharacterized protein n=1 Tax=Chaetoceros debilis TaxID=122233 RepID=A0A7S3Q983_9STRA
MILRIISLLVISYMDVGADAFVVAFAPSASALHVVLPTTTRRTSSRMPIIQEVTTTTTMTSSTTTTTSTTLFMDPALMDPTLIAAAAAGIAGSAAGWASRSVEITDLQSQSETTNQQLLEIQSELKATKIEYQAKKGGYEEALYEMDAEFEGQTDEIQKVYEQKLEDTRVELRLDYKVKLARVREELYSENEMNLIQQEGTLRQGFLQEKLAYEVEFNSRSAEEVVKALDRQSELVTENQEIKTSLENVQRDLKEIMKLKRGLL